MTTLFSQLNAEMWLAKRLQDHGAAIFDGDTTVEIRRARFAEAILGNALSMVIAGRGPGRKAETYGECFFRLYGMTLETAREVA